MGFLKNLTGLRTIIAIIAGAILAAMYGLDLHLHDVPSTPEIELAWLSPVLYETIGKAIAGFGGVTFMLKLNNLQKTIATAGKN